MHCYRNHCTVITVTEIVRNRQRNPVTVIRNPLLDDSCPTIGYYRWQLLTENWMANMRLCRLCSTPFPDDARNCPKCGAVHTVDGGKKLFWIIAAIFIAYIIYHNVTSEPNPEAEYRAR